MNERIKLLKEQCYETGPIGKDGWPEYSKFNEEKFAELIVAECIDICNQAILQNQDTLSKLNTDELAEKMIIHG
jgi:hypothetical protein